MSFRLASIADVPEIVAALRSARRVAVDTEFHPEKRYLPQLYLIQLYTGEGPAWVIDPLIDGLVLAIAEPLRALPWIVHGGQQDLRILTMALGGSPAIAWDTQIAAALVAPRYPASYASLAEHWLGIAVDKGATLSDWSRRPLSAEQVHYAAHDVLHLPTLWDRLAEEVDRLGRGALLHAACAEVRERSCHPDPREAWREIGGHAALAPQQAAVLRALAEWRDDRARAEDQVPRNVIADAILLDFAKRQPTDVDQMATDRRLPRHFPKRYGEEVLEVLRAARETPPETWPPMVARETASSRRASFYELIAEVEGASQRFAARLVAPRLRMEGLALQASPDRATVHALLGDWRDALLGDRLTAACAGAVALRDGATDVALTD